MKSVIATLFLAIVVGVGVWAIVVTSGPSGPVDVAPGVGAESVEPGRWIAGGQRRSGGIFKASDVAGAAWPIFRGRAGLTGSAVGDLGDSLRLVWTFAANGPVNSSVAVGDGRVFVASEDGSVYALNLIDGKKLWSFRTGGDVEAPPLLLDGTLFVGSTDSFLYAIDASKGRQKWKYNAGAQIIGSANWFRRPDGDGMRILVCSNDEVHCIDAATGGGVWKYKTEHLINGAPAVADQKAVFGNCGGIIHVISAAGKKVRTIELDSPVIGSPAAAGRLAWVGNFAKELVCMDLDEGKIVWRYADADGPFYSSPAVSGDRVVAGSQDEQVHCIDRSNGKRIWVFTTGGAVDSSPVVCGDRVVVASDDGRLYLLNLSDGKELWSYEIGQPIKASPAVAGKVIIVGSEDGVVYAFGPK